MIACFSTTAFSSGNTGVWLKWLLKLAHLILSRNTFDWLHAAVRKSAHFSAYGMLSVLFFRAWRGVPHGRRWKWSWALLALAVCLAAASLDEYHQSFTPGRTAAVSDVELDMMGAVFAQLMVVAWTAGQRKI